MVRGIFDVGESVQEFRSETAVRPLSIFELARCYYRHHSSPRPTLPLYLSTTIAIITGSDSMGENDTQAKSEQHDQNSECHI